MTTIKEIKHEFLAFRNGIVSDTLRKAGLPFGVIFGLQLPQLRNIASSVIADMPDADSRKALACQLLDDTNVRESRILAYAVMPPETVTVEEAVDLCADVRSREEADLLPFLLLRHTPHIPNLIGKEITGDFSEYLIEALRRFA